MTDRHVSLLVAALATLGAVVVLRDLLAQVDRLSMANRTTDELDALPTTDDPTEDIP